MPIRLLSEKNAKVYFMFLFLLISLCMPISAQDYYVAVNGNDNNPGTADKPFATIQKAQQILRSGSPEKNTTVIIKGGVYYLDEPIIFTSEDSGKPGAVIEYKAYPGEDVIISGGFKVKPEWKLYKNGIYKTKLKTFTGDQLFVNGKQQHLARYPNYDSTAKYFNGYAADAIGKERAANWKNPAGGYIHAMHKALWGGFHYRITGKDADGNIEYEGGWQNNRPLGMHPEIRFVENIFEELDAPGEWYYDSGQQELYYYPAEDVDLKTAVVEGVRLPNIIEFKGTEANPVKYIKLTGITFRHASRTFMETKEPLLRSDWTIFRGGAVLFNGAENCSVENCFIDQVGGNAIFVNNYNRSISIKGCHIYKAGANGIAFVGSPDAVRDPLFAYDAERDFASIDTIPGPKTNDYPANCLVEDCLINEIGRVEKQTAGVEIEMSRNITISHCTIYDVPRAGINIGSGCWGGHVIEYCDVFNTVLETGDHGAFNSWGRDRYWVSKRAQMDSATAARPELVLLDAVEPNVIHDNRFRCDHGWDIDLDDGSSNYHIYNNVCLNGGLKLREGFYRTAENNIMINNSLHTHVWFENSYDVFVRNIVTTSYSTIRVTLWGEEVDYNIFPDSTALAKAQANNTDMHSITASEFYIDPKKGDYRVRNDSEVLSTGFKNFDMDNFGVVSPELKKKAKRVDFPELIVLSEVKDEITEFMGMKVKNLKTLGEVSATGMAEATGVLVLEVPNESELHGYLRPNDVILKFNKRPINNLRDLIEADTAVRLGMKLELTIYRDQKEQEIMTKVK